MPATTSPKSSNQPNNLEISNSFLAQFSNHTNNLDLYSQMLKVKENIELKKSSEEKSRMKIKKAIFERL